MSSYIGQFSVDGGSPAPVGSSLYGVCDTGTNVSEKVVTLSNFDYLINGITVHVKFTYGNSVQLSNNFTLQVGSTNPHIISNPGGNINWSAGTIISFTYDSVENAWIVNDSDSGAAITIESTYNSNSTNAISGKGVANALTTLGAASKKDVISSIIETGINANKTSTNLPTTNAIVSYVDSKTAGFTNAMHYRGRTTTNMSDDLGTDEIIINGNTYVPVAGDVILAGDHQEYIWTGSKWELFGDEGLFALKTNTENVIKNVTFTPDVPGSLTTKNTTIPNVTNAGRDSAAVVENGILKITTGKAPTLGTNITIKEVDTWREGTAASLNTTNQVVVIPGE